MAQTWKDEDISNTEYDEDPSEIEAREMEEVLYEEYTQTQI